MRANHSSYIITMYKQTQTICERKEKKEEKNKEIEWSDISSLFSDSNTH